MTRSHRILRGVSYGYVNAAAAMLAGLWLTPFLLRHLGVRELGLWFAVQQLLGYVLLLDLGIVALLPREAAAMTGSAGAGASGLPVLVGRTVRIVLWQMPVVAVAAALVWIFLPAEWTAVHRPAAILLVAFVVLFPARVLYGLLFGLQDMAFVGRVQLGVWAINLSLIAGLVLLGYGLYALAFGWAASQLFAAVAWGFRVWRRFPVAWPSKLPSLRSSLDLERLKQSGWISTAQIAQVFLNGSDMLVIGYVLGPAAIVAYACTGKLVSVLANQPQLIMQTAAPALSQVRAGEPAARLESASAALTQAMLLVSGAVGCVVVAVNAAFVGWWVGPEQYLGPGLTILLVVAMLLRHWNITTVYALFARGYDRHLSLVTFADGMVTVLLAILAVHWFGVIGAPLAMIVGACCVGLPLNLRALARDGQLTVGRLVSGLRPWALRFVPVFVLAAFAGAIWQPVGIAEVAALALAALTLYLLVVGPLALRAPLGPYLRPWLAWR